MVDSILVVTIRLSHVTNQMVCRTSLVKSVAPSTNVQLPSVLSRVPDASTDAPGGELPESHHPVTRDTNEKSQQGEAAACRTSQALTPLTCRTGRDRLLNFVLTHLVEPLRPDFREELTTYAPHKLSFLPESIMEVEHGPWKDPFPPQTRALSPSMVSLTHSFWSPNRPQTGPNWSNLQVGHGH